MRPLRVKFLFLTVFSIIFTPNLVVGGPIPICVSIVPQKYFVQQIGKDRVHVQVMVQPGASPATYEPKPKQMAALSKTKIYYAVGVPFENVWLKKIAATNPEMMVVHTDDGISKMPMETLHHNQNNDDHPHGILDPHIWTSPLLVKLQARHIFNALAAIDARHESFYIANYKAFLQKIEEMDAELKKIFSGKSGTEFMVFHPAWGYFAHSYGLKQIPIELEGKAPKPAQLQALVAYAKERRIRVIFVQPQFSAKSAQTIAKAIDGRVVVADPLALNWEDNLRRLAAEFKTALR